MSDKQKNSLDIGVKSFISAIIVIFCLMVTTYILTLVIPGGSYLRFEDANGNMLIDRAGGFREVEGGLPFSKVFATHT